MRVWRKCIACGREGSRSFVKTAWANAAGLPQWVCKSGVECGKRRIQQGLRPVEES